MATYPAIAATSKAIIGLLDSACPRDVFPDAEFAVYQAVEFESRPVKEGLSLYLYRVAVNRSRPLPHDIDEDGVRRRPPLPVDLFYMLTAWGKKFDQQQMLLGWALRELEDAPSLPAEVLNSYDRVHRPFRRTETVELAVEPLALADLVNLWEVAKTNPQPSVGYVARMVHLHSTLPMPDGAPVRVRDFGPGKVVVP